MTACYAETLGVLNASFLSACFSGFRKLSYNAIGWVLYSFVPSVFCPTPCGLFSLVLWSYIRVLRLCRDAHSLSDLVDVGCCILTICPPSWCLFFWTLLPVLSLSSLFNRFHFSWMKSSTYFYALTPLIFFLTRKWSKSLPDFYLFLSLRTHTAFSWFSHFCVIVYAYAGFYISSMTSLLLMVSESFSLANYSWNNRWMKLGKSMEGHSKNHF